MTKTMPVELDLLQDLMALIDHNIKFESHPAKRLREVLAAPVVDEPPKYPVPGHIYTNKNFGPMKYIGIENCPDGKFMMFRATEMRKEKYYTAAELPKWFAELRT